MIAGVLTIIPVLVVWLVLNFVFDILFRVGEPAERALIAFVAQRIPGAAPILTTSIFEWFVAVVTALLLIYAIGAAASHVVGTRLIALMEGLIERIPGVQTVYSASKSLIGVLQQQPGGEGARVVLLDFPYPGVKVIGLVMRTFTDTATGEEIAAVYVPTTPNPTSGYLELVPAKMLTSTDMTMEQAMTMIISGGAITPDRLRMSERPKSEDA